jgi:cephalosporin hydroxylase
MSFNEYQRRLASWSDIVDHLPRLYDEACRDNVTVIELGVRGGNSTAAFMAAAELHDGHVWSVDINECSGPWGKRWTFIQGDDMDPEVIAQLPECDVLFVDSSHHYEHTLAELKAYVPKVKDGGVVLLHDTELEMPYMCPPDDPPFPVTAALRTFIALTDPLAQVEWVSGCNGLGVYRIERGE